MGQGKREIECAVEQTTALGDENRELAVHHPEAKVTFSVKALIGQGISVATSNRIPIGDESFCLRAMGAVVWFSTEQRKIQDGSRACS